MGGPYVVHTLDINGGGTTSTGGPYSISASTGQAGGVGTITAEPVPAPPLYQFDDGFWSTLTETPPTVPLPDPSTPDKCRFISFSIPIAATAVAGETALRVRLTSLHLFGADLGFRYVNLLGTGICPDSVVLSTTFRCAVLSCTPEYRDWATLLGGEVLHVTGKAIVPSSTYSVAHLAASCAGQEASCSAASADLTINTIDWGNVNPADALNVLDVAALVDKVKDLATGTLPKPQTQLQPNVPNPLANVNVLDIANGVDALKDKPYPFPGPAACP